MKKTPAATKVTTSAQNSADSTELALVPTKTEPRVDSRLLAKQLGIKHPNLFAQVKTHKADFEQFGKVTFQTGALPSGQSEKFATLNEDQAYLLLTYSRNTAKVRGLKVKLVQAFSAARKAAEQRRCEYLPTYHLAHDALKGLAPDRLRQQHLHMNVNKLLNKVAGLDAGQRHGAQPGSLSVLAVGQMLAAQAATGASDDKAAYARIKQAVQPLDSLAKPQLLEVAQ